MKMKKIVLTGMILFSIVNVQAQGGRVPQITQEPVSDTIVAGGSARFTVVATGSGLSYQWQKNNAPIAGATAASFTISSATLSDEGLYRVIVSNTFGRDTSVNATLVVQTPPVIVMHPRDTSAVAGQTLVFGVSASGSDPLSYQWQKNGVNINDATGPTLTISPVQAGDSGVYRVIVFNDWGSAISDRARLTVFQPPRITTEPHDTTVRQGQTASFTVVASGSAPLTYRWQKNGVSLLSMAARAATYTITSTQLQDSGFYRVIVSNSYGSDTSSNAFLKCLPPNPSDTSPPQIIVQPRDTAVVLGGTASFLVVALSAAPLTYQWEKDGAAIRGAQGPSYTIGPVIAQDTGRYRVIVSNRYGLDTSNAVTLSVGTLPKITQQPSSASVEEGGAVGFLVLAVGTAPLSYQWQKNGAMIAGAVTAAYRIDAAALSDSGTYQVIVSNPLGRVVSNGALLFVNKKSPIVQRPVVTGNPASKSAIVGDTVTFTVSASGTAPLSYQWQKNGADIAGAQSAALTLAAVALLDSGAYRVIVSNKAGSDTSDNAVLRVAAKLVVQQKPLITRHPSPQAVEIGGSAAFTVTALGSTPLYYQWQRNGADIPNAKNSTCAIAAAAFSDSGLYRVIVFNALGADTSVGAYLQVLSTPIGQSSPVILQHPSSLTVFAGDTATFTVSAAGAQPLLYQWQKNGLTITGANKSILTIASVSFADSGTYRVIVSNSLGGTVSLNAIMKVKQKQVVNTNIPPVIREHPSSKIALVGDSVTFTVITSGSAPLSYQWQKNGVPISGATAAYLKIASVAVSDTGAYRVTVSNVYGSETSLDARLSVYEPPRVMSNPASQMVLTGAPVTFSVAAKGSPPLAYQWQKNGINITGATAASFTIALTALSDSGTYRVVVANPWGTAESEAAILIVKQMPFIDKKPVITMHPSSQTVKAGDPTGFTVIAVCTEQMTYQWQKNDVDIPEATAATFKITSATAEHAGTYRVVVSSRYGSVTSNSASLTVLLPWVQGRKPDIVSDPASITVAKGDTARLSVSASGSAPLYYQWRKNGADITGATDSLFGIDSVRTSDGGSYDVVVTNFWGSDTSKTAVLTVKNTGASAKPVAFWTRNPVRASEGAFFTIDIPDTGKASACIADAAGNMVYNLIALNTPFNPGVYRIEWRGQNSRGSFAGPGTYIYVLSYTRRSTGKTTVIRKPVFLVK